MNDIFTLATTREFNLSPTQFRSLVQGFTIIRQSGVVQFTSPPDNQLIFLFVDGIVVNAYLLQSEGQKKIPPYEYLNYLGGVEGKIRILTLPSTGMRIGKMFIECRHSRETFQLQTSDLKNRFNGWSVSPNIVVIHLRWPEAEAAVVFPGKDAPIHTALFIRKGKISTNAEALSDIHAWGEKTCTVTYYTEQGDLDAWQEYRLHLLFVQTLELILTRYNNLAGRSLVAALDDDLNANASSNGWKIIFQGNGVIDNHIFESPHETARIFRSIYNFCLSHIEKVIGEKLTFSIVREVHERLDKERREILRTHPMFSPEEGISAKTEA